MKKQLRDKFVCEVHASSYSSFGEEALFFFTKFVMNEERYTKNEPNLVCQVLTEQQYKCLQECTNKF